MKSKNLESKWINEEDKKLIIESKNGNKNAIYRIIKKYEKMIFWVLNKEINTTEIYKRNETNDIRQQWSLAIIEAIKKYDLDIGVSLTTYFYFYIRSSLQKLLAQSRIISIQSNDSHILGKIGLLKDKNLSDEELAKELWVPIKTIKRAKMQSQVWDVTSLNVPIKNQTDEESWDSEMIDFVKCHHKNPAEEYEEKEKIEKIYTFIENSRNIFSDREREILGFRRFKEKTLEEIWEFYWTTRERIRQIEQKVFYKIDILYAFYKRTEDIFEKNEQRAKLKQIVTDNKYIFVLVSREYLYSLGDNDTTDDEFSNKLFSLYELWKTIGTLGSKKVNLDDINNHFKSLLGSLEKGMSENSIINKNKAKKLNVDKLFDKNILEVFN